MMKFDTYFFDLDGTIADSSEGVFGGISYAAQKVGFPVPSDEVKRTFIGPPLTDSFIRVYGCTDEEADALLMAYREYYVTEGVFRFRIFDGMCELLKKLKAAGKDLYVVTSKPTPQATTLIEAAGLSQYFTEIIGATLDGSRSKKVDVLRYALTRVKSSSIVMVGDTDNDILGAKAHNLPSIAVRYGFGTEEEFSDATYIVDTALEILDI